MRTIGFLPLARPRAESSRVAASEIGVAGLSLLLLAVAGCVLLVMAARFDRGRLGG
jgi:apolipoprotein N-acyltransferase